MPPHLLEMIDQHPDHEIIIRPVKSSKGGKMTVDETIQEIEKSMNAEYPMIETNIIPQLRKIIGISEKINKKYACYSDREVLGISRMDKYL